MVGFDVVNCSRMQMARASHQSRENAARPASDAVSRGGRSSGDDPSPASGTQSIERAVRILREIAAHGPRGMRAADIAQRLGLERPTAYRILKGLAAQRMLVQDEDGKRFRLGQLIYELGLAAEPGINLRTICHPVLKELAERTGDCVFLVVRSGLESVCIDREAGTFPVRVLSLDIGVRRPLGLGAGGLALLLTMPEDEIGKVIAANARLYRDYGRLTTERLQDAIVRSRKAGFAVNDEDVIEGVSAIGLAIRPGNGGAAFAALAISGVTSRFNGRRAEVMRELSRSVKRLERKLDEHALR
jgi:DNA-binding IclR family transcriptional regulator